MVLDMNFYKVNGNGKQKHLHYFRKHSDLPGVLQDCWLELQFHEHKPSLRVGWDI